MDTYNKLYTAPAWQALTPAQRSAWYFWAADNPVLDHDGNLRTLYGYQAHYRVNSGLLRADETYMISEPPAGMTPHVKINCAPACWPLGSRLPGGETARRGVAYLELREPTPDNVVVVVTQGYRRTKNRGLPTPAPRHVNYAPPSSSTPLNLAESAGTFLGGVDKKHRRRILGRTATRRRTSPYCALKIYPLDGSDPWDQTVPNPYG